MVVEGFRRDGTGPAQNKCTEGDWYFEKKIDLTAGAVTKKEHQHRKNCRKSRKQMNKAWV